MYRGHCDGAVRGVRISILISFVQGETGDKGSTYRKASGDLGKLGLWLCEVEVGVDSSPFEDVEEWKVVDVEAVWDFGLGLAWFSGDGTTSCQCA